MFKKNFSLIELLIVIGIMGALAALILPAFSDSESQAKDTACDYNNAGTLRYVTMFRGANGVYPSGFHAGVNTASGDIASTGDVIGSMAVVTAENMAVTEALDVSDPEDGSYGQSLREAGIAHLAFGKETAEEMGTASALTSVRAINGNWSENLDASGNYVAATGDDDAIKIKGVSLAQWATAGDTGTDPSTLTGIQKRCRKVNEPAYKLVPLFAAPTMDWETAYPNGGMPQASKVSVAMEGKCPWLDSGTFRYYICLFKVYEDGTAAKLVATACPECGILDADTF